jgi:hypothetical protein
MAWVGVAALSPAVSDDFFVEGAVTESVLAASPMAPVRG